MSTAVKLGAGALRELRIHLCQKSASSNGVREFIQQDYVPLKKANRDFPILIREASGINPKIWARYEYGVEKSLPLENTTREQVAQLVADLAKQKPPGV
ncbi:Complex I-B8 [Aphelenchoides fujianensis]|nr:Complex I-B8 [Aphelenchoides fujianensis]KAI6228815.1 Complex I-B8 [Aphelenchoides fujianensis]KAI6242028.1 Complex I-B8 [Aphelenchoides fujianensis]